jgi:large subunit ribosomal protein L54
MICRTCLRRAAGLAQRRPATLRPFTTSIPFRNAAATAAQAAPELSTPLSKPGEDAAPATEGKAALSSCKEGTVLTGLNYLKNKSDPVAKADEEYPEWLWKCLEVQVKASEEADEGAGDEFCKTLPPPSFHICHCCPVEY